MSFSRFQAWLKPCLGSLEPGTGRQCLWTLWRARNHSAAEQNAVVHEQNAGRTRVGHEIRNTYWPRSSYPSEERGEARIVGYVLQSSSADRAEFLGL